jgi:hypothetical protein
MKIMQNYFLEIMKKNILHDFYFLEFLKKMILHDFA